jgi:hypothetical protein
MGDSSDGVVTRLGAGRSRNRSSVLCRSKRRNVRRGKKVCKKRKDEETWKAQKHNGDRDK